jgi:translation initiation factor IF-1
MRGASAIVVEGIIVETLPNGTYRAELANGHRLLAYVAGRRRLSLAPLALKEKVRLELSPYDLSEGRIIVEQERS